jgi:transcription antitermination factor NusG
MNWLACSVVGSENEYRARCKIKAIAPEAEILVPRVSHREIKDGKVKIRSEKMFPGYILVGTEQVLDAFQLKAFIKVIGRVSQLEMERVRAHETQETGIVEVGAKIMIIDGAFQGCKGHVESKNEDETLHCIFNFQGMQLQATLKPELVSVEK